MYKVNPDGSIECQTPEEALRLQRAILSKQPDIESANPRRMVRQRATRAPSFSSGFALKFKPYDGKLLNADQMAKIFEIGTTAGVGPKLRHARNALAREGYNLDDILEPSRSDEGRPRWTVKLSSTLPSA